MPLDDEEARTSFWGAVIFDEGVYHVYDYQFFYRNLQENVKVRTEAYKLKN